MTSSYNTLCHMSGKGYLQLKLNKPCGAPSISIKRLICLAMSRIILTSTAQIPGLLSSCKAPIMTLNSVRFVFAAKMKSGALGHTNGESMAFYTNCTTFQVVSAQSFVHFTQADVAFHLEGDPGLGSTKKLLSHPTSWMLFVRWLRYS